MDTNEPTRSLRWPGAWLEEELTEQERIDCRTLEKIVQLEHAKGYRHISLQPDDSDDPMAITPEYAAILDELSPYLNSFMHLLYQLAKSDQDQSLDWALRDPIGATMAVLCLLFSGDVSPGPDAEDAEYQLSLFRKESQKQSLERLILKTTHPSQSAAQKLLHLSSRIPANYIWPVDKITRKMQGLNIDGNLYQTEVLPESKNGKKPAVFTKFYLSYIENDSGQELPQIYGGTWTQRDQEVESAYFTLYDDGIEIFTPEMLLRTMYGRSGTEHLSSQQLQAITLTIEKHRILKTRVDCTEEFTRRGLSVDHATFHDPLLQVSEIEVEAGGRVKSAYRFLTQPIRLSYIKSTRQLISVPFELLDIKELDKQNHITTRSKSMTEPRLFIRNELLRRIEGIKNPHNRIVQKTIALESYSNTRGFHKGLYEIAGYPNATKQQAEKIRKFAKDALDFWKAKQYIHGYTLVKKKNTITGIQIHP